jgi:hypothetical protein
MTSLPLDVESLLAELPASGLGGQAAFLSAGGNTTT